MEHENDVSSMVDYLQVVSIYIFVREIKLDIRIAYIVVLFVKTENSNFYKRNVTCSPCLHSLVKTSATFVIILEQVKTLDCISGSHWSAIEFSKCLPRFLSACKGRENMFYFLNNNLHKISGLEFPNLLFLALYSLRLKLTLSTSQNQSWASAYSFNLFSPSALF